ncbi:putative oxalate--CoA ligase [Dioscorea sansibarensis]
MISFNSNATLHGLQLHCIHFTHVRVANPFARSGFLGFPVLQSFFHSVMFLQPGGSLFSTFMDVVKVAITRAATHDHVAIRADNRSYSFRHLVSSAWSISNLLHAKFSKTAEDGRKSENASGQVIDINRFLNGARVGIVAKPSAEFVAGLLGIWLSGGVAVPLPLSYPEAELLHVMNDSDVSMILSTPEHQELMKIVAAKSSAHFSLIPAVNSIPSEAGSHEHSENGVTDVVSKLMGKFVDSKSSEGDDPALTLYTSGTTGKPKGVVHTHKSIISQVQILTEAWEYTPSDLFLHCLPLHHIHVRGVWQRWRESYPRDGGKSNNAITLFTGVPTMYTRLLQGYDAMDPDMKASSAFAANKLRLMMCGSSALPYPVMKQWEEITGHRLLERYGMTEFVMALAHPLHGNRKGGTVGIPLPRVEVKIITEEKSEKDGPAIGELCVRSPSLFKEYWKQPKVTAESFIDGGFFKTGDTVTVDEDGYYIILGRTSADIMKVGGYKLSALDIEAVLLEHEDLLEVCVLGLPDKDYGEIVCAIVVPQEHAKKRAEKELKPVMTLEEFQSWAKERLAPYKIPTKLVLWDTLPRNAMGKVNKKEIKKLLLD